MDSNNTTGADTNGDPEKGSGDKIGTTTATTAAPSIAADTKKKSDGVSSPPSSEKGKKMMMNHRLQRQKKENIKSVPSYASSSSFPSSSGVKPGAYKQSVWPSTNSMSSMVSRNSTTTIYPTPPTRHHESQQQHDGGAAAGGRKDDDDDDDAEAQSLSGSARGEDNTSCTFIEATLVSEPELVQAVPMSPSSLVGHGNDADADNAEVDEANAAKQLKTKKKKRPNRIMIIIMVIVVVLIGVGVGLGVALVLGVGGDNDDGGEEPDSTHPEDDIQPAAIEVIDPIDGLTDSRFGSSVSMCEDGSHVAVASPVSGIVQVFEIITEENGTSQQIGQTINSPKTSDGGGVNNKDTVDPAAADNDDSSFSFVRTSLVVELSKDCNVLAIGRPFYYDESAELSMNNNNATTSDNMTEAELAAMKMEHIGMVELYYLDSNVDLWAPLGNPNVILGQQNNEFSGASLSLSDNGGVVAIGSPGYDDDIDDDNESSGSSSVIESVGRVRLFELNGNSWTQKGSALTGSVTNEGFGFSVSLSRYDGVDIVAVGKMSLRGQQQDGDNDEDASPTSYSEDYGVADVFQFQLGSWQPKGLPITTSTLQLELSSVSTSWFVRLSESGDTLVVSNLYVDDVDTVGIISGSGEGNNNAALYVAAYKFEGGNKTWVQLGSNIHANEPGAKSGYIISLSSDGTRIGMGDPGSEIVGFGKIVGHAHFYEYQDDRKRWCQLGPDIEGDAAGDLAGYSVSVSGDGQRIIVGSPTNRYQGQPHGRIRIYEVGNDVVPNCDL
jgi:hypothetical protein